MEDRFLLTSSVPRRWLLGFAVKSSAVSCVALTIGELFFVDTAAKPSGLTVASSNDGTALARGNTLSRLSISPAPVYGAVFTGSIIGATPGSTIKLIKNLTEVDLGIDAASYGARRYANGQRFPRSFLIRERLAGISRDTLIFASDMAPRKMKLGMNVAGVNYYSPNDQFLDYLKCAEVRIAPETEDANGMPLTLKPGKYGGYEAVYMVPLPDGRTNPVKFRVITDGDMDFNVICLPAGDYDGPGYGTKFLRKDGSDWSFTHNAAGAGKTISYFKVTAVRIAPTFMALVRDDEAALYRAGKICRPEFSESLRGFEHIRWLNQSDANLTDPCSTPTNYITYATQGSTKDGDYSPRCVPLEMQVKICIELGIGGWFHEHIKVTDAQAQIHNAHYDKMNDAGLLVKKELSNEIWNGQFAQYAYGQLRAAELGYAVGNPTDHNSYEGAVWFNGYRTAQLAALDRGKGYKWCIGCQPANPAQASRIFQGFAAAGGNISDLSIWTTANYMTGTSNRSDGISAEQFNAQLRWVATDNFPAMFDNVLNFPYGSASANRPLFAKAVATARAHGLDCECYEGTSAHLNSASGAGGVIGYPGYDSFLFRMIDQQEYYGAVTQNLEIAQEVGIRCCTAFDYNSLPNSSIFGRFGLLRTPGYAALKDWVEARANMTETTTAVTNPDYS
jgi:hypothetical protein